MKNNFSSLFEKSELAEQGLSTNVERQQILLPSVECLSEEPCSLAEFLGIAPQSNIIRLSLSDSVDGNADTLCELPCFIGQKTQGNVARMPIMMLENYRPSLPNKLDKLFADAAKNPLALTESFGKQLQKDKVANELTKISQYLVATGRFCFLEQGLCVYEDTSWHRLNNKNALRAIRKVIEETPFADLNLSVKNFNDLVILLKTTPSLEKDRLDFLPHAYMINCRDGIYDVRNQKIIPSNPDFGFFNCANLSVYEIGKGSGAYFESFVSNAGDDVLMFRTLILEIFLVIFANINVKKFFLLLGPGNTGKTQLIVTLLKLIGDLFSMSVRDLGEFDGKWTFGSLVNKRLCACLDLPNIPIGSTTLSKVKQLVGDDAVLGEVKYEDPFSFYSEATLLFASNHKLVIQDVENEKAFLDRLIVVPFNNPVSKQDKIDKFYEKLMEEFPYILGEAIKVAAAFINRNENFCELVSPYEGVMGCTNSNSKINLLFSFTKECCLPEENAEITTDDLFNHVIINYPAKDNESQIGYIDFARKIKEPMLTIGAIPIKDIHGTGNRGFRGLRLKEAGKKI